MQSAIDVAVEQILAAERAELERACEQALTTPPAGVGVMRCGGRSWPDARVRWGTIADVTKCPQVVDDPDWRSAGWAP